MRCPKCHYLSFDPEPRCRNCGFDLEGADADLTVLAEEVSGAAPDLPLRRVEPALPAPTLELVRPLPAAEPVLEPAVLADPGPSPRPVPAPGAGKRREPAASHEPALELVGAVAGEPARLRPMPPRAPHTTAELPLFVKGISESDLAVDGPPLADPVQAPPLRATRPLSVRRSAEAPRPAPRIERRVGPLDHDLLEDLRRVEREEALRARVQGLRDGLPEPVEDRELTAGGYARAGAAAADALLLGGIAAFVFWATLRISNATPSDLGLAAIVPLCAFVALIGVSYLLMFTAAGGQTVGKMIAGIRVVGASTSDGADSLTMRQVLTRALLAPLSVVTLGAGWLPVLLGRGAPLHDRLSGTRVVRA